MVLSSFYRTIMPLAVLILAVSCSQAPEQASKQAEESTSAEAEVQKTIEITNLWARPTLTPSQPGGVYLDIVNHTDMDDVLVSVSSPRAGRSMMHDNVHQGDVVRMVMLNDVVIAAGTTVHFAPGGKHLMLFGLDAPLQAGEGVPLVLTFRNNGDVAATAVVAPDIAGSNPQAPGMQDMHGH